MSMVSGRIAAGLVALAVGLSACGPANDDAEVHVSTSEPADGDTTMVVTPPPETVTNTVVEQRTDTVVKEGVVVQKQTDTVVKTVPGNTTPAPVPDNEKQLIDGWLSVYADSLNQYGDPEETVYTGGTPLYNESTGQRLTKYQYIVMKHPDKPWAHMNVPVEARPR